MAASMQQSPASIKNIQINGLVVMKIAKHSEEDGNGILPVQGVLLGLMVGDTLEITNCFPFPRVIEDNDFNEVQYQMEMMRNLRHLNIDHFHVGWYQTTYMGSCFDKQFLESQFMYQDSIEESVVIVYDSHHSCKGSLSVKAYRLTSKMMDSFKDKDKEKFGFSQETVKKYDLHIENLFEEVPVFIKNSHLTNILITELEQKSIKQMKTDQLLSLDTRNVLEKNVRLLMDKVDELIGDSNKNMNYCRSVVRQQQQKVQHIQKRQQLNEERRVKGEVQLPEEDLNKMFKPQPPPPKLESITMSSQTDQYCKQTTEYTSGSFGKFFMASALR